MRIADNILRRCKELLRLLFHRVIPEPLLPRHAHRYDVSDYPVGIRRLERSMELLEDEVRAFWNRFRRIIDDDMLYERLVHYTLYDRWMGCQHRTESSLNLGVRGLDRYTDCDVPGTWPFKLEIIGTRLVFDINETLFGPTPRFPYRHRHNPDPMVLFGGRRFLAFIAFLERLRVRYDFTEESCVRGRHTPPVGFRSPPE
jgi:hypothetical protein